MATTAQSSNHFAVALITFLATIVVTHCNGWIVDPLMFIVVAGAAACVVVAGRSFVASSGCAVLAVHWMMCWAVTCVLADAMYPCDPPSWAVAVVAGVVFCAAHLALFASLASVWTFYTRDAYDTTLATYVESAYNTMWVSQTKDKCGSNIDILSHAKAFVKLSTGLLALDILASVLWCMPSLRAFADDPKPPPHSMTTRVLCELFRNGEETVKADDTQAAPLSSRQSTKAAASMIASRWAYNMLKEESEGQPEGAKCAEWIAWPWYLFFWVVSTSTLLVVWLCGLHVTCASAKRKAAK